MDYLVRIKTDLYDIASRVKELDADYYIEYNVTRRRYEIHHKRCRPTLSIVAGDRLDQRVITQLQKTRITRLNKIIEEIDKTNKQIERAKEELLLDEAKYKAKQISNYLGNGGGELPPYRDI